MAVRKNASPEVSLVSEDPALPKPRLTKLVIRNYRCIGSDAVQIDLDDIVLLVGPNNTGKSTILRAYKLAMSQGSSDSKLTIENFPGGQYVDPKNLPQIEVHTVIYGETVGRNWIDDTSGERIVKEKWTWHDVGTPVRQGWDVNLNDWSPDKVPWGAPNVANSYRPEPHIVDAFASPEEQTKELIKLLKQELDSRVKAHKERGGEESEYHKLLKSIGELQKNIAKEAEAQIKDVSSQLTTLVAQVFPGYRVDFDVKPETNLDNSINLFKSDPSLLMGIDGEHLSVVEKQGSGARRTLLWMAIKFLAESARKAKTPDSLRPHLLLIDEPEICLHPTAIREATNALYSLPKTGKWQVMATTHSPIFVDFTRDNTTIIRVSKDTGGIIRSTTVFRPSEIQLGKDDKENLKLLNICDPYVAEFFFGGRIIIVEGDTEYTAFNYIKSKEPALYRDVHIIRARGKATIVSIAKVLNHFGAQYSILHDSDTPLRKDGNKNSAWTSNQLILDVVSPLLDSKVSLFASLPNFEQAYFGLAGATEKPYKALKALMEDELKYKTVRQLFSALLDETLERPSNCIKWSSLKDLENEVDKIGRE